MPRYSSYTPRRRYTRKKRGSYSGIRKSYKKFGVYKKNSQRVGFNKRVDYPQLRHDVMLAGHTPVISSVSDGDATITLPSNGLRFTIWSPSYRVQNTTGRPRDRVQKKCLFVGVKENLFFSGESNVQHRRVVFWSRESIDAAMPFSGPDETMLRNINLRNPEEDSTLDPLMGGTRGQDFLASTIPLRKFDPNVVEVVYDNTESYSQYQTLLKTRKFWHRCEREVIYQDKEGGMGILASGWSGLSSKSAGNLYVVDMYFTRGPDKTRMDIRSSAEVYWREGRT